MDKPAKPVLGIRRRLFERERERGDCQLAGSSFRRPPGRKTEAKRRCRWLLWLPIGALAACICLAGCGRSTIPSDVVVQIGNSPITMATLDHWMTIEANENAVKQHGSKDLLKSKPVVPDPPTYTNCIADLKEDESKSGQPKTEAELRVQCEKQYKKLWEQTLEFLITSHWEVGQAKEQGIEVSGREVQRFLDLSFKGKHLNEAGLQRSLSYLGETTSDLLWKLKVKLLSRKLEEKFDKEVNNKVNGTTIAKYYHEHEPAYDVPEERDVQIVLTKTAAQAERAKGEIRSGKRFTSVARKDSIDPTVKENGGLLKEVVKGEDEQAFTEAVFSAKVGVLGGPVHTPFGYYIYEVEAVHPPVTPTFAQVRSAATQSFIADEKKAMIAHLNNIYGGRWVDRTKCRSGYVVKYCGSRI